MKPASLAEIRNELKTRSPQALLEFCLQLARAKKDNKAQLGYLLFDAQDPDGYLRQLKEEIDTTLTGANRHNLFLLKKQLRKLIGFLNTHLKYMGNKPAEAEVWLYYCHRLQQLQIPYKRNLVLSNLYEAQLKKIRAAVATLHEDLQHDFNRQLDALS